MKYILILFIIAFSLIGCDGQKDSKTVIENSITKLRKRHQVEHDIFFPKVHLQNVTDTIYSNGKHIRIKNYTVDNKAILINSTLEKGKNIKTTKYRRVLESEITIYKDSRPLFIKHLSLERFKYKTNDKFWSNVTLEHVWVNDDLYNLEQVNILFSFINPIDNTYKLYKMYIDEKGIENIYLIEDNS